MGTKENRTVPFQGGTRWNYRWSIFYYPDCFSCLCRDSLGKISVWLCDGLLLDYSYDLNSLAARMLVIDVYKMPPYIIIFNVLEVIEILLVGRRDVILVAAFAFFGPKILGRWWGPRNDIFSVCECSLSIGSTLVSREDTQTLTAKLNLFELFPLEGGGDN